MAPALRVCPEHGVPLVVTPALGLRCPAGPHAAREWWVVLDGEVVYEAGLGGPLGPPRAARETYARAGRAGAAARWRAL